MNLVRIVTLAMIMLAPGAQSAPGSLDVNKVILKRQSCDLKGTQGCLGPVDNCFARCQTAYSHCGCNQGCFQAFVDCYSPCQARFEQCYKDRGGT
jgi:hypothetical protein